MGNESSGRRLRYLFGQRLHGADLDNIRDVLKPDPELERHNSMLENILRWEDDGGQLTGAGNPVDGFAPTTPRANREQIKISYRKGIGAESHL